jgi:hypothetical protein
MVGDSERERERERERESGRAMEKVRHIKHVRECQSCYFTVPYNCFKLIFPVLDIFPFSEHDDIIS